MTDTATHDGRRLRGDASRRAVLRIAVDQASLSGLDSLTIGALATDAGVSKSNVATLFGSMLGAAWGAAAALQLALFVVSLRTRNAGIVVQHMHFDHGTQTTTGYRQGGVETG